MNMMDDRADHVHSDDGGCDAVEHPRVQRIRDAYAALTEGDLAEALKDIAPTATFHIGGSGPL